VLMTLPRASSARPCLMTAPTGPWEALLIRAHQRPSQRSRFNRGVHHGRVSFRALHGIDHGNMCVKKWQGNRGSLFLVQEYEL